MVMISEREDNFVEKCFTYTCTIYMPYLPKTQLRDKRCPRIVSVVKTGFSCTLDKDI